MATTPRSSDRGAASQAVHAVEAAQHAASHGDPRPVAVIVILIGLLQAARIGDPGKLPFVVVGVGIGVAEAMSMELMTCGVAVEAVVSGVSAQAHVKGTSSMRRKNSHWACHLFFSPQSSRFSCIIGSSKCVNCHCIANINHNFQDSAILQ